MHDLTLAAQYGERILLVDRGAVIADGTGADVLTREQLETLYGAKVRVLREGDRPVVVPVRR
jgi:iron complex transport system ATP-binding protein